MRGVPPLLCLFLLATAAHGQFTTSLKPETLAAFEKYQTNVDQEIRLQVSGQRAFQWVDQRSDAARKARLGEVVTHAFTGTNGQSIPDGLIHDWVGVIYLSGAKLETVRDFILNADKHEQAYAEVKRAKVLSREANQSITSMRVLKKKYLTAVLDIEYDNKWQSPAPDKWAMAARSRKVIEIKDAGTPEEKAMPEGIGHGFLWRMNSFWLLRQDKDGVWAELRVVSLSRDTPRGLGWIIRPLIRDFPVEGITSTLRQTQAALRK